METANTATRAKVSELLALSEDALLEQLGADLFGNLAMPADPRDMRERAVRFFDGQREGLQLKICTSPGLKNFALKKNDSSEIVIEVLKIISSLILPVSPVVLAVLIVRQGLLSFCPGWAE